MKPSDSWALLTSLSFLVVACGDGITRLSDLQRIRLTVRRTQFSEVYLDIKAGDGRECFMLSSRTQATMNGASGTALSYSGVRQPDESRCRDYPQFRFVIDPTTPGTSTTAFAITDNSKTLVMDVQDFLAPRTIQLTPATDIRRGQPVTLTWPASADVLYSGQSGGVDKVSFESTATVVQGTYRDQSLTVTIPPQVPLGVVRMIWLVEARAPILRCDGALECIAFSATQPWVEVTVVP